MDLKIPGLNLGVDIFLYFKTFGQAMRPTQPSIQWVLSLFLEVKRSECEVEHLSLYNAEVKIADL
jgi:hypothetical protein